jgi:glutamine amidotransferase
MDNDPRWRLLAPGELVHVDKTLHVTRSVVLPDPPAHLLRNSDLSAHAQQAQHTSV